MYLTVHIYTNYSLSGPRKVWQRDVSKLGSVFSRQGSYDDY